MPRTYVYAHLEDGGKIVYWWNPSSRSWVVQTRDKFGNQVGDADYVYTKDEAMRLTDYRNREVAS